MSTPDSARVAAACSLYPSFVLGSIDVGSMPPWLLPLLNELHSEAMKIEREEREATRFAGGPVKRLNVVPPPGTPDWILDGARKTAKGPQHGHQNQPNQPGNRPAR